MMQAIYICRHMCDLMTNVICDDIVSHTVAEVVVDSEDWRHRIFDCTVLKIAASSPHLDVRYD